MNRLQRELQRLYVPPAAEGPGADAAEPDLVDAQGRVRAMVIELARPADWQALSRVWQGVQADLALPAPAIAVSGHDGYQLWFSLVEPVPAAQAMVFLEGLHVRYLADIPPHRVRLLPAPGTAGPTQHARLVPAPQADDAHWSAFVAPDLAPMFTEEPWLDTPPNTDGQAALLSRLASIRPADFGQALERLAPTPLTLPSTPLGTWLDPRQFLLQVMNDERVALGLRIEAAKALLPGCDNQPPA